MTARPTTPLPAVRPLPLAEIEEHVWAIHDLLNDWASDHPELTVEQLPLHLSLGLRKLADKLDGTRHALDMMRRGQVLLPCGGANDA